MNKIKEIFKSWNIALDPNEIQAELASKRIEICNSCEFKVENLGFNQCSVCGCALKAKVFSPVKGACPKGKWNEIDNVMINQKIFVQIASYRDPELIPTIKDCISKAKYPERLTFGICWQHSEEDEWDNLDEFKDNEAFTIMDVKWNESKGLCWARHHIQKMYKGEEYTMQIDSHHRFVENWDEEMIEMLKLTGSKKPILTAYAGMYDPKENKLLNFEPYKMVPDKFTPGGTILFYPHNIENWEQLNKPIPARFVSGHFFFTIGKHCEEYHYDPNIYFAGDEISLSIRSYTLGYDLFHPHRLLIWHEYTREGRTKHWTDFSSETKEAGLVEKPWWEMDNESKRRLRHMLQEEDNDIDLEHYGLGTFRSHRSYELYAGINFHKRKLHPNAIKGINPPTTFEDDDETWIYEVVTDYSLSLNWENRWEDISKQLDPACTLQFIYVGIENDNGEVLFRVDLIDKLFLEGHIKQSSANFSSKTPPTKLIIWPYEVSKGWLEKVDIKL
jgi:hypothetical protein